MPFTYCYISTCKSSKKDSKLFHFPRDDSLREEWVKRIAPHFPEILELTKKQLMSRLICIRHFEPKFLIEEKRLYHGCPTLITDAEILSGIPTMPMNSNPETDHTYSVPPVETDHTYHIMLPDATYPQPSSILKDISSTSTSQDVILYNENIEIQTENKKYTEAKPASGRNPTISTTCKKRLRLTQSVASLTPKCRKLYNKCILTMKRRKLFGDNKNNIENANKLNETKSFQKLVESMKDTLKQFFLMELRNAAQKKKARRYNLEEKLLCLALLKQSGKGYKLLERIFSLPTKRTLNRVLQDMHIDNGINTQFFQALKDKIKNWSTVKKLCSIVFDEVKLSTGITYVPSNDVIHGFVSSKDNPKFADHALVFMLRGICASWRQPIAFYFCEGTMPTAELIRIIKEIVHVVLSTGFEPSAFICDQGMTNQSALRILQADTKAEQLRNGLACDDTISIQGNKLSIIFDPPHLLKGIRNNLLSKDMVFEGKIVKWQDIIDIYNYDCQIGDIRMLPKLSDEHVIPEKIKKMKVSNCAKVLSERVAATLRYTAAFTQRQDGGRISDTAKNTADAVEFFDKLFDSCNGSRGGRQPGKLRGPVKTNSPHQNFWRNAIKTIEGIKYIEKGNEKQVPTLKNWVITMKSLLRLSDLLFSKGICFFYTRNFNQDPLENLFGKIRAHNVRNNDPDAFTFQNSFKSLIINNIIQNHSNHANCEEDVGETILNLQQLLTINDSNDPYPSHTPNEPQPSCSQAPSTNTTAERIRCNARGYTAGYIIYKISKWVKCNQCKKTMVTQVTTNAHDLILFRERKSLKNKNLKYPTTEFIVAFSVLIDCINNMLEINCNKNGIAQIIKSKYLSIKDLGWMGCSAHKHIMKDKFIKLTCKLQIFNWCRGINQILSGTVQTKVKKGEMSQIQIDGLPMKNM